jgi:hypothetical protein
MPRRGTSISPTVDRRAPDRDVRWRRAEATLWRRTLDGIVVLPVDRCEPLALRGPAAGIWELLAQPMTLSELLDAIAATYGVDGATVADAVGDAVGALASVGALCRL